jgi:hypothetical protein
MWLIEVGALIFGVIAVTRGEFSLTRNKVVRGVPARVVGILLILVLPVALLIGIGAAVFLAAHDLDEDRLPRWVYLADLGVFGVLFAAALIVALVNAGPRDQPRRRWEEDEPEEDEDFEDRRERYHRPPDSQFPQ